MEYKMRLICGSWYLVLCDSKAKDTGEQVGPFDHINSALAYAEANKMIDAERMLGSRGK